MRPDLWCWAFLWFLAALRCSFMTVGLAVSLRHLPCSGCRRVADNIDARNGSIDAHSGIDEGDPLGLRFLNIKAKLTSHKVNRLVASCAMQHSSGDEIWQMRRCVNACR